MTCFKGQNHLIKNGWYLENVKFSRYQFMVYKGLIA